ncbi:hypothetical protein [Pedococcus soli]
MTGSVDHGSALGEYRLKPNWLVVSAALGVFTAGISIATGIRTDNRFSVIAWSLSGVFWIGFFFVARRNRTVVDTDGVRAWRAYRWVGVSWEQLERMSTGKSLPLQPRVVPIHWARDRSLATDVPVELQGVLEAYAAERNESSA